MCVQLEYRFYLYVNSVMARPICSLMIGHVSCYRMCVCVRVSVCVSVCLCVCVFVYVCVRGHVLEFKYR